ncbi:uncharacterized protein [Cicer arietinum]|uniref:Uncharacterized protein LOC105852405 n=1 Tax=Cicer arietinum TaxID=3827 RepID=A0A3Q7YFV2_CICAR|nr:uncharacterized protein LOC105852405 [Cicer arietinum]
MAAYDMEKTTFFTAYGTLCYKVMSFGLKNAGATYQRAMKRLKKAYEKKIRPREFQEGDLVLKKILPIQKDYPGKWTPNYEGPYVVKKAFSGGALILTNMDGKDLALPVNSNAVKKYYA